jgi:hypothetical protein
LYWRSESSLGGEALIATEGVSVSVFNAGYALRDVTMRLSGAGDQNRELFDIERSISELYHGGAAVVEIPSYEVPAPLRHLKVSLESAEFGQES